MTPFEDPARDEIAEKQQHLTRLRAYREYYRAQGDPVDEELDMAIELLEKELRKY